MSEELYSLVFRGDIVFGHHIGEVKQALQKMFKTNEQQIERLFTGRPLTIKKNLPQAEAERYRLAMHKAGAEVEVKPQTADLVKPKPAAGSMAERLAAQSPPLPAAEGNIAFSPEAPQADNEEVGANWQLAPVGSDMIENKYRDSEPPVTVTPVDAELRPMSGNLLDPEEMPPEQIPPALDLSELSLAEADGELLRPEEKAPVVPPLMLSAEFEVAPVGARMGPEEDQWTPAEIDLSHLKLQTK